ncbi:MAG: mono/diheme cytochrome c family protein [Gammaproteobacteria bacterium]|jgi:mono/diheme cytochrome c family protein
MIKKILALSILTLIGSGVAAEDQTSLILEGPRLGQPATPVEVAAMSINVFPDGRGLPEGSGSVTHGASLYQAKCIVCHGASGYGSSAEPLAGAEMGLTDEWPEKTIGTLWPYATTLFDFIRRSMPMTAPGTLSNDETYALTAYLLYLNNIVAEDVVLNKETLMQVKMPNVDGFIDMYKEGKNK